jgi:hypothetical protein
MLKRKRNALTTPSQPRRACAGVTSWLSPNASVVAPKATHSPTTTSVTSGPAAATRNSSPGDDVSRVSFAMPPKNHRSMPDMPMPLRRATSACPSSWSTSETKKSAAPATAVR